MGHKESDRTDQLSLSLFWCNKVYPLPSSPFLWIGLDLAVLPTKPKGLIGVHFLAEKGMFIFGMFIFDLCSPAPSVR